MCTENTIIRKIYTQIRISFSVLDLEIITGFEFARFYWKITNMSKLGNS